MKDQIDIPVLRSRKQCWKELLEPNQDMSKNDKLIQRLRHWYKLISIITHVYDSPKSSTIRTQHRKLINLIFSRPYPNNPSINHRRNLKIKPKLWQNKSIRKNGNKLLYLCYIWNTKYILGNKFRYCWWVHF